MGLLAKLWSRFLKWFMVYDPLDKYEADAKKAREAWLGSGDCFGERYKARQKELNRQMSAMLKDAEALPTCPDCGKRMNDTGMHVVVTPLGNFTTSICRERETFTYEYTNDLPKPTTFSIENGNLTFDELANKGDAHKMMELQKEQDVWIASFEEIGIVKAAINGR